MLEKLGILALVLALLFLFYLVIALGAKSKQPTESEAISNYLRGIRYLLFFLAFVAILLFYIFIEVIK